jgi:hypothetical protein
MQHVEVELALDNDTLDRFDLGNVQYTVENMLHECMRKFRGTYME